MFSRVYFQYPKILWIHRIHIRWYNIFFFQSLLSIIISRSIICKWHYYFIIMYSNIPLLNEDCLHTAGRDGIAYMILGLRSSERKEMETITVFLLGKSYGRRSLEVIPVHGVIKESHDFIQHIIDHYCHQHTHTHTHHHFYWHLSICEHLDFFHVLAVLYAFRCMLRTSSSVHCLSRSLSHDLSSCDPMSRITAMIRPPDHHYLPELI